MCGRPSSALVALVQVAGLASLAVAQAALTPLQAKDHIGEMATVCGKVATARYAPDARGQPTFLNLDVAYPKQVFTVMIWGYSRDQFGTPEVAYKDKALCVTGRIASYRGEPQIVATERKQIKVKP